MSTDHPFDVVTAQEARAADGGRPFAWARAV